MTPIRLVLGLLAAGTLLTLAIPAGADATHGVAVFTNGYRDQDSGAGVTTITRGTTVTWTWESGVHSVTAGVAPASNPATGSAFQSGNRAAGSALPFSVTFDDAGTYAYYCAIHATMRGIVIVE